MKKIYIILIILIIILMGNYGLRISNEGEDVLTCDDKDCAVTSKYANLKGSLSGSGTSPNIAHNTTVTITIAHGLGHIPSAKVAIDLYGTGEYFNLPYFENFATGQFEAYAYCDATNLYIKIWQGNDFGETWFGLPYEYKIFIDKGKL